MKFTDFTFKPELTRAITRAGFTEPSPIQEKTIPLILEGKDIVGQAHTGTGKTAAFALPTLQMMEGNGDVEVVVIVPTRELTIQVADEFYKFSRNLGIRTATVYGGSSYKRQLSHIKNAGVVVATPGRFLDLLSRNKISINPKFLILDEADEMLNMGFLEDIRRILSFFKDRKQTLLFSATMPEEIKDLAKTIQNNPEFIRTEAQAVTKNSIDQYYYVVEEHERDDAIIRLLDHTDPDKSIIFCRTKKETERLCEFLKGQGYDAQSLHGDVEQRDRQKVMKAFRRNEFEILVATDVAARGIDIRGVSHVFNYHIPFESESYVHRIGRTGRAQKEGVAMMLVTPYELGELERIKKEVGSELTLNEIPSKTATVLDQIKHLTELIAEKKVGEDAAPLLKKVSQGFSTQVVAEKLLMILAETLGEENHIGKKVAEVKELLEHQPGGSKDKKNQRHGRRNQSRNSNRSRGNNRRGNRSSSNKVQRGTKRGQVPVPEIKKTESGARIIARKLY
jgi:ATP-dependent RNA helicase DeaD